MPGFKNHTGITIAAAVMIIISAVVFSYRYNHRIDWYNIAYLLIGLVILPFLISPDLDSPKSKPTQHWSLLKIVWNPFVTAGHRGILHSYSWGTIILCGFPYLIIQSLNLNIYIVYGLVISIWLHITADKINDWRNKL